MIDMFFSLAARSNAMLFDGFYMLSYILCIAAIILSLAASVQVKSTFSKYSAVHTVMGITAAEAARRILDANGLYNVQVQFVHGNLTDNYNPSTNIVSLSEGVYNSASIAAIAVAAHECGHAVQHAKGYIPVKIRTAIVPVVNLSSRAYIFVIILGMIFSLPMLVNIGLILFALIVVFQLVTLPVEFNASFRALDTIKQMNLLGATEMPAARKTLTAAAMTYVASLAVTFTQFLRLFASTRRRR